MLIAHKRFLLMIPPYSLMKSAFLWAGLLSWWKWILQSHSVKWVHFITVAVPQSQNRKGMKVCFTMQEQEQSNVWKMRTSFTNCHGDSPEFFAFFWNCRYTAAACSAEWIWVHVSTEGTPEESTLKRETLAMFP